jgi:hypothetical protein
MIIHYLKGDATYPIGLENKILCHICNDINAWDKSFVLAISKRWRNPELMYRTMKPSDRVLGNVQFVHVEKDIVVANMIAQHDIKFHDKIPPIRYEALKICLERVNHKALKLNATIHMPRIGCGLAGSKWSIIEDIIREVITVDVYVYDLL